MRGDLRLFSFVKFRFFPAQSEDDRTVTLQVDGEETTLEFVKSKDFQAIKHGICFDISPSQSFKG